MGEVVDGAESGDLEVAAIRFREELPERLAQGGRLRTPFEVGTI
jgi:hypothetical protein